MKLNLGILYYKGEIVNHRSLFKVILNPVFRYFGYCIGSKFENNKFKRYIIFKCKRNNVIKWSLIHNEFDEIIKKRIIY